MLWVERREGIWGVGMSFMKKEDLKSLYQDSVSEARIWREDYPALNAWQTTAYLKGYTLAYQKSMTAHWPPHYSNSLRESYHLSLPVQLRLSTVTKHGSASSLTSSGRTRLSPMLTHKHHSHASGRMQYVKQLSMAQYHLSPYS